MGFEWDLIRVALRSLVQSGSFFGGTLYPLHKMEDPRA
jgi:hypothetical protein